MNKMLTLKIRMWALLTGMMTIFISSIIVGVLSHFFYWLLFDSFGRSQQRNNRKLKLTNKQKDDEYYAIIIGTGFSGLGMAIRLNKLGMRNYILLERHDEVGGTWYANTYPGCACDVPSTLYSFSFEPNPNWSHYFARQGEIGAYLKYCADKYKLRSSIRFNTNVTELRWLEDRQLWQVKAQSREGPCTFYGRSIVLGTGPLSNASYPENIVGIKSFQGKMCHTAAWDKTIDFKNKRVAIVGTGASAIQAVPEIHQMGVSKLYVFQRTAPWIVPRIDRPLNERGKEIFRRFPLLQKLVRLLIYWATESFALSFVYRWPLRFIMQSLVRCNLEIEVPNEKLRKLVTPKWEFGCKRMLLTTNWYSTLQKSNVQLVTSAIQELTSDSIRTQTGDEFPVDIIIWSTGFQTQTFPLSVYGVNRQSLIDRWSHSIQVNSCLKFKMNFIGLFFFYSFLF